MSKKKVKKHRDKFLNWENDFEHRNEMPLFPKLCYHYFPSYLNLILLIKLLCDILQDPKIYRGFISDSIFKFGCIISKKKAKN